MAEVIRCDRCGKIIDKPEWTHKTFQNSDANNTYRALDICDECHESYEKWLKQETSYIDTDILVRLKKDLEHKSKLADKRKEEIDKGSDMRKYSRQDWDDILQKLMKMMQEDYPNNYELVITSFGAEIKSNQTDMCFVVNKTNEKTVKDVLNTMNDEQRAVLYFLMSKTKQMKRKEEINKAIDILKGDTEDALR